MTLMQRVRRAIYCCILIAPTIAAGEPPTADQMSIMVRGQSYNMLPYEYLRERGVRVPEISHEDNAAFRYFDAVNAHVRAEPDIADWVDRAAKGEWPEDAENEAALLAHLDANANAISLTREATQMDDYFLPLFGNVGDPLYSFLLPSLSDQRHIAKLLAADAQRQIRAGEFELGMDRLLTAQRMLLPKLEEKGVSPSNAQGDYSALTPAEFAPPPWDTVTWDRANKL